MNLVSAEKKIEEFIAHSVKASGAKGVVVGMSGGLDSTVVATLCVRALGHERVLGVMMPSVTNTHHDLEDAKSVANNLKIRLKMVPIKSILESFKAHFEHHDQLALGNLAARIRMCILYYYANHLNYLVAGTGNKSELSIGYFCYDAHTRALTTEGLKNHKDLKQGDTVFSLDLETQQVVERPVADVHVFDYDGDMLGYGGEKWGRLDLMVTPNHRMLVERRGRLQFCRADELPRRPTPMPVPRPWAGEKELPSFFEFNNARLYHNAYHFAPMPIEDFFYLLGLYIGDGHAQLSSVSQLVKGRGNNRDPKSGRYVTVDMPATLKEYSGYRTWFALPKGSKSRSKMIGILEKNGIPYGTTDMQIYVCGKPLYEAMADCGTSAKTKHIPSWVLDYPSDQLKHLLDGLMDSDGCKQKHYYTISHRLATQVVELGCKLGKNVTLLSREPRIALRADGVSIKSSTSYDISIYGNGRHWLRGAEMKRVSYKGIVWCPDIPDAHNFFVERNGRFLFCGNTKYGDGGCDILPIGDLYKTEVRELAKHLSIQQRIIERTPTAGLWPGQTDEADIGMSYADLDKVLRGKAKDPRIAAMVEATEHKRYPPHICRL